jgi:hypothetical protein
MRVAHHRIVYARVETTLYCVPDLVRHVGEPQHTEPMRFYIRGHPTDGTFLTSETVELGRRRGFLYRAESSPLEEHGHHELIFSGRVSPEVTSGQFRFQSNYDEDCRTGGYKPSPSFTGTGMEILRFKALRT